MANDVEPPGIRAEIGVSKLFFGDVGLELASSSCYIATLPEFKYPCIYFTLKGGDDLYLGASSISFMKLTDGALYLSLRARPAARIAEFLGRDFADRKDPSNRALVIYFKFLNEESYVTCRSDEGVQHGGIDLLVTLLRELERFRNAGIDSIQKQLLSPRSSDAPFIEELNRETFNNKLRDVSLSIPEVEQDGGSMHGVSQKLGEMTLPSEPVLKGGHLSMSSSAQNSKPADKQTNGHHRPRILGAPKAKNAISPKEVPSTPTTSAKTPQQTARPTPSEVVVVENQLNCSQKDMPAGQAEPNDSDVLCRFPNTSNGVDLHYRDMGRLPCCEMLNDTNIELGMKYVLFNENYKEFQKSCYVFNTYFFAKITKDYNSNKFRNAESRSTWSRTNYAMVKRWTRKVDIFEQEHIVIPINDELHWCILIIKNPKALLRHQDDPNPPTEPCLYIMLDSIPDSDEKRNNAIEIMRDYFQLEFEDKKKKQNPHLVFDRNNMKKVIHKYNPVQKNYIDCGVYLLAFFEQYVSKLPTISENYVLDWIDYSPFFEVTMIKYYREKLIKFIKSKAGPRRWSLLEKYERRRGGVTNPSVDSRAAVARKTRSHSFCQADWVHQRKELQNRRNRRQRAHSAPIRYDILLSTKPLVITRENGVAQGRIN